MKTLLRPLVVALTLLPPIEMFVQLGPSVIGANKNNK